MAKVDEEVREAPMRMVELVIDRNITVRRTMVPAKEVEEGDLPLGARALSVAESKAVAERAEEPEDIRPGHRVHRKVREPGADDGHSGTVAAELKTGKVRVEWDNGVKSKEEKKDLARIW
jgi:hypothetical protein